MSSLSANINQPMPPVPAGAVVVPGASTNAPVAPAVTGGGGAPADQAQVVAMLQALVAILTQLAALQGAQAGAAGVQGGGGATFPPTTMGGFVAGGPRFGPVVMGNSSSFGVALTNEFSPFGAGVVSTSGAFGASFAPTPDTGTTATTNAATTAPVVPGATGGGATAAPAVMPVIDMRRVLGNPQSGDVIATIIHAATLTAQPSKSEGQYIIIQDMNGAQLQAHVHGAWSSHPGRIKEGIERGFVQVHLHEDGTLHLHDVM